MYRFKNSLIAFAGLSALIGLVAAVTPNTTQGQAGTTARPAQEVTVVNTAANPVPVVAQGTSSVTLASPVQIGNGVSEPIPVSPQGVTRVEGAVEVPNPVSVQTSPRQPLFVSSALLSGDIYQQEATLVIPDGDDQVEVIPSELFWPSGMTLELEYVSAEIEMGPSRDPGQTPSVVLFGNSAPWGTKAIPLAAQQVSGPYWIVSQPAIAYIGNFIVVRFRRFHSNAGQATLKLTVTGRLHPQVL
jgi:hypothetical protein